MPLISLPDGSQRTFNNALTGLDLANDIGPGLAKAAVAMVVNGQQRDLSFLIQEDSEVSLLTAKDEDGMDVIRHTLAAQVLARAVKLLFPKAKLAIGPTIEHGFYYDIAFPENISSDRLPEIQEKMQEILKENNEITREEWPIEQAKNYFAEQGETYKVELVEGAVEKGENTEEISVYVQRDSDGKTVFVDLCRGPHVPAFSKISAAFTLTNLAAAYWRGDAKNDSLTRVYALCFADKKQLKTHQNMLEEAAKRDHRKLGKELDLYHFEDSAPGQVYWHDKGWIVYLELIEYMRKKVRKRGYIEVNTPQMMDVSFWKWSGHWDKYRENMFVVDESEEVPFALKPMNCPGNVQVYKQHLHSYRDLPIRMLEFGKVFRHEAHGARHGLMRVQSFTQDDAHIFCTPNQLEDEVVQMCELIEEIYNELGFTDVKVKFSTRPEQRIGSEEDWDRAEEVLQKVCDRLNMPWELNAGDGAFYAPKLDFVLTDAIGREWQCGTIQVDMNLPDRLDITYMGEDGEKHRPCMVHRALMGSIERFFGVMVEHYAGHFPLWLAPVQVVAMGITDKHDNYVKKVVQALQEADLRVEADLRNEKVNYKIREHSHQKVPVILVMGDREEEQGTVTLRRLGSHDQTTISLEELVTNLREEVASKILPLSAEQKAAA